MYFIQNFRFGSKLFEELFGVMPDFEEIFVSSQKLCLRIRADVSIHVMLAHP